MGWDITYHPVGENEVKSIYFQGVSDLEHYKSVATQFTLDEFYTDRLRGMFDEARKIEPGTPFNKGHGFYIAIVFGFLRKYHYVRGGVFSFLRQDNSMAKYIGDWSTLVPDSYKNDFFENELTENYCAGVYLPHDKLHQLRADYLADAHVKSALDEQFSHGRIDVFWKSVDSAIALGFGLIEASEVVEPNPFDLNASTSYSNLFNCEKDGVYLYEDAAKEQVSGIAPLTNSKVGAVKGFFTKLFGK